MPRKCSIGRCALSGRKHHTQTISDEVEMTPDFLSTDLMETTKHRVVHFAPATILQSSPSRSYLFPEWLSTTSRSVLCLLSRRCLTSVPGTSHGLRTFWLRSRYSSQRSVLRRGPRSFRAISCLVYALRLRYRPLLGLSPLSGTQLPFGLMSMGVGSSGLSASQSRQRTLCLQERPTRCVRCTPIYCPRRRMLSPSCLGLNRRARVSVAQLRKQDSALPACRSCGSASYLRTSALCRDAAQSLEHRWVGSTI